MRTLIVGMNYVPEVTGIGPFTAGLAEHLANRGHEVVVATTFPHYPHWQWQPPMARLRRVDHLAGVRVRRMRIVLPRDSTAKWRVIYDTSFAAAMTLNNISAPRPDLVLCVSPPIQVAFAGALLARAGRVPLVLLLKDLPVDAALSVGMLRRGVGMQVARLIERRAYALADRIVVISDRFRASLAEQGVHMNKVVEIPDWANTDRIQPRPPDMEMRALLGAGSADLQVLHIGNMGEKQGLSSAVHAADLAQNGAGIQLTLVGDGAQRKQLADLVRQHGIANVRLLPVQPDDAFNRMLSAADVFLLNQRADVLDSVAPSKLLTYMAAGRPILAAAHQDSVAAQMVREAGCGIVVAPEDAAALAAAMKELSREPKRRVTLGQCGRKYVESRFGRSEILERWEKLLSAGVSEGPAALPVSSLEESI